MKRALSYTRSTPNISAAGEGSQEGRLDSNEHETLLPVRHADAAQTPMPKVQAKEVKGHDVLATLLAVMANDSGAISATPKTIFNATAPTEPRVLEP